MSIDGQINAFAAGKTIRQVLKDPKNGLLLIETECGHTLKIKHADGDFFFAGLDVNIKLPPLALGNARIGRI